MPHDEREAALELVIIVAVEQIVLAIVLVVQHRFRYREARLKQLAFGAAFATGGIGPLTPAEVGVSKIRLILPDPLIDQRLQSGAVGARLRAEDAIAGAACRVIRGNPC